MIKKVVFYCTVRRGFSLLASLSQAPQSVMTNAVDVRLEVDGVFPQRKATDHFSCQLSSGFFRQASRLGNPSGTLDEEANEL